MARWVSRGAGFTPVAEKRAMMFVNSTLPRGVSLVKVWRSVSQPEPWSDSSMRTRAFSSSGEPDGRGPTSTCLRAASNALSPENSFQISAGTGPVGRRAAPSLLMTLMASGRAGSDCVGDVLEALGAGLQAPRAAARTTTERQRRRIKSLFFLGLEPEQSEQPLQIIIAVIFNFDTPAILTVMQHHVRGEVLLKSVLQMLDGWAEDGFGRAGRSVAGWFRRSRLREMPGDEFFPRRGP